jgi:hypothetical protein
MQDNLEPTRRGGVRRTRVAQTQSAAQMKQRTVLRMCPRVLKFAWKEPLGLPECPYVIRWRLELFGFSVRVHHWLSNDDDRAFHDHPWWFLTFVVKGGYTDENPDGLDILEAPAVRFRKAEHQHTVHPHEGGCWTLLITGRPVRTWGFWANGNKFVKANKWFLIYGHHPCK